MIWVGLTGGIATGKSTVAQIIKDQGLVVIDADQLAREVIAPQTIGWERVVKTFGSSYVLPDQSIDRKKLGQLVFADSQKRLQLEGLLHPLIQDLKNTKKLALELQGCKLAFYEIPLLFEKKLKKDFDIVIVVASSAEKQIERLMQRNSLSKEDAEQRLQSQLPIEEKIKNADYVIFNNDDNKDQLRENVLKVLSEIIQSL